MKNITFKKLKSYYLKIRNLKKLTKKKLSSHVRGRGNFFNLRILEKNIYQNLAFHYKKHFYWANSVFQKHKERILTISLFLLTTSSLLCKKKGENHYTFHWRDCIRIFRKNDIINLLSCSIIYLLENNSFKKEEDKKTVKEFFTKHLPGPIPTFEEAYLFSVVKKNNNSNDVRLLGMNMKKYSTLVSLAIKLSEIIKYEISKNYSKVLDLIKISDSWKEKMNEIFGFKSEYIAFLYFLNLRRKSNNNFWQNLFIRCFYWLTLTLTKK